MGEKMRAFGQKIAVGLRHFMLGRYGADKLNTAILLAGVVCCILSSLLGYFWEPLQIPFVAFSYLLLAVAVFRMLSRNTYVRYRENTRFLIMLKRMKDRQHRYYACPKCSQTVRVPKGKGKISVSCPKCGVKFIKKT